MHQTDMHQTDSHEKDEKYKKYSKTTDRNKLSLSTLIATP
jgi:hypothetical protein